MQYIFLNYSLLRIFGWSFFVRASPFDHIGFSYVEHNSYLGPTGESSATFEENKKKQGYLDRCMPNNLAASQHRDAIAQFNFVKNFYFFLIATIQVTRPLR